VKRRAEVDALPRHRHGLSREAVQRAQRKRVLRATAEAVAEHGYRAATIADIVRRAGVSTKTFYELFADKEDAMCAVYDGVDAILERHYESEQASGVRDARARMHASVAFVLELLAADATVTRVLIVEATGGGPRILARRNQLFHRAAALIASLFRDARAPLDETLIVAYLGGLTELVLQHIAAAPVSALHELVEPACRFTDALFFPRSR
jgi:AcrR family transcriptional regulator